MATYKLIGQRILRKYSASRTSPVYASSTDAQLVVSSLCDVPWTKVSAKDATMTYHTFDNVGTEEDPITGLDMNVRIRDEFDAALFCAEHTGGQHRAYANAAVYRYELPNAAVGVSLTSLKLSVTSDPYNSNGARIHMMTNSTGVIPTSCHTCRGEDASGTVVDDGTTASRVAVRTSQTVSGKEYWYPTNSACTLTPTGGLTLQKYLFVFVLMESYSTVRGNWIEGCSFIENKVELTTSTDVSGWTDGSTIDLSDPVVSSSFKVACGGVLPGINAGYPTGIITTSVRSDANLVIENDNSIAPSRTAAGTLAAAAVSRLYDSLFDGKVTVCKEGVMTFQNGSSFNVDRRTERHVSAECDTPVDTDVLFLESKVLLVPFVVPLSFTPTHVRLSFMDLSMTTGARFNVLLAEGYLTSLTEEQLKNPGLYDLNNPPFELLGTVGGGSSASFKASISGKRSATLVISGYLPPESYNVETGGLQGTGNVPFLPNVTITE